MAKNKGPRQRLHERLQAQSKRARAKGPKLPMWLQRAWARFRQPGQKFRHMFPVYGVKRKAPAPRAPSAASTSP